MPSLTVLQQPSPPPGLSFDNCQFEKRAKAVSATTGISFSDYQRLHVERRKSQRCKKFIPAFAYNGQQLRMVLATAAWRYARGQLSFPEGISLAELKQITDQKFENWCNRRQDHLTGAQRALIQRHILSISHAGGWLQLHSAIAYMSWKLGIPSTQIAERLYMTAPGVRIILHRLTKIARLLGFDTFKPGSWMGKNNVRQKHMTLLPPSQELLRIHKSNPYWTAGRLSKRFHVRQETVRNALCRAKRQR
ncbi:MAG: hypothetical protein WAM96_15215 [Candidatus Acidiferrales bacterium]